MKKVYQYRTEMFDKNNLWPVANWIKENCVGGWKLCKIIENESYMLIVLEKEEIHDI